MSPKRTRRPPSTRTPHDPPVTAGQPVPQPHADPGEGDGPQGELPGIGQPVHRPVPWYGGEEAPQGEPADERDRGEAQEEMRQTGADEAEATPYIDPSMLSPAETRAVQVALSNPTMSARRVAMAVGSGPKSAIAQRLGAKGDLRAHVRALMARHGLGDDYLLRKLKSKVEARETKFFSYQGKVLDQKTVIAHEIQLDALKEALKLARLTPQGDEDATARSSGPPSLLLQLNLTTPAPSGSGGVSIALGPSSIEEVSDATAPSERSG